MLSIRDAFMAVSHGADEGRAWILPDGSLFTDSLCFKEGFPDSCW